MSDATIKYIISRIIDKANLIVDSEEDKDFNIGKRFAYYEVLDTIQGELLAHDRDLAEFGLDIDLADKFLKA